MAVALQIENDSLKKIIKYYEMEDAKRLRKMFESATKAQLRILHDLDSKTFDYVLSTMIEIKERD
ncbi:MAG: hypothetical protein KAU21_14350 [Gammaproteobacteria bacterium]|nr:hypothetical protein [Gammaproteobacteria bacterium]